jgi:hypothetical protein
MNVDHPRSELKDQLLLYMKIYPVVALNSVFGFIRPIPVEEYRLNKCHPLNHPIGYL